MWWWWYGLCFFLFFFIWTFIYASCLGYNSTTWFIKLWCSAWYESVGRIVWRFLLSNKISIWLNGGIIFQPNIWLWNCAFAFAYCIRVALLTLFLMHATFLLEFGLPGTQNKVFGVSYSTSSWPDAVLGVLDVYVVWLVPLNWIWLKWSTTHLPFPYSL